MKYLCLIYQREQQMNTLSKHEWDALIEDCVAYTGALERDGRGLGCGALQSVHTATTVRVRDGRLSTTDGPFAETKEQLAGYCLIEAADLDAAIDLAAGLPPARYGCIEIRPVRALLPAGSDKPAGAKVVAARGEAPAAGAPAVFTTTP